MQLHGQVASISVNVNNYVFCDKGWTRNTVQFLNGIVRNHECQFRNVCKNLLSSIELDMTDVTEKKEKCLYFYIYGIDTVQMFYCLEIV